MFGRDLLRKSDYELRSYYTEYQVKSVLNAIGVDVASETTDDFLIFCPYHNNSRTPACEVHKEKGLFVCFSCQERGELIDLVAHMQNTNFFEAIRLIDSFATSTDDFNLDNILQDEEEFEFDQDLIKRLNDECITSTNAIEYFKYRGITLQSIKDFSLGYSDKMNMVTVPIKLVNGKWGGFVGRLASKDEKRFKNSNNLPRGKTLFNLDKVTHSSEVFVVDASFDAIRIHQCGFPVVATLGGLTRAQAEILNRYFSVVHIIADNKNGKPDETSIKTTERAKKQIKGFVDMVTWPKEYKDAGEMTDKMIDEVLSSVL